MQLWEEHATAAAAVAFPIADVLRAGGEPPLPHVQETRRRPRRGRAPEAVGSSSAVPDPRPLVVLGLLLQLQEELPRAMSLEVDISNFVVKGS
ncbi:Os01g0853300 [Oryza sativa Japonica Group]|jgi:hypothetical protein|uniref:Os01g0853300 protein n=1 Tax=Oryza sativa subsp. japonica TaxID=39947 RepID=A0A0P0VAH5_ORYSJ|nr:Os01g0853300 [Oryza sativa Japonica Group]